jgi:hypothetical protein
MTDKIMALCAMSEKGADADIDVLNRSVFADRPVAVAD